jgi:hypothetical protein
VTKKGSQIGKTAVIVDPHWNRQSGMVKVQSDHDNVIRSYRWDQIKRCQHVSSPTFAERKLRPATGGRTTLAWGDKNKNENVQQQEQIPPTLAPITTFSQTHTDSGKYCADLFLPLHCFFEAYKYQSKSASDLLIYIASTRANQRQTSLHFLSGHQKPGAEYGRGRYQT